jgi:hypothetical protein
MLCLVQVLIDGVENGIRSVATESAEIVSVQRPHHSPTKIFGIGEFNLQLNRLLIIEAKPLVAVLDMWYLLLIIPRVLPITVQFTYLIQKIKELVLLATLEISTIYLIVADNTHFASIRTGFASSIGTSVQ